MAFEAIKALPAHQLAAPDCALIMSATSPMLPQAIDTMRAWRFLFKSAGAWAKQSRTGAKWAFGTGYCYRSAAGYRSAAEFLLLGNTAKPRRRVRNAQSDRSTG